MAFRFKVIYPAGHQMIFNNAIILMLEERCKN
jgi:hypothetical protein